MQIEILWVTMPRVLVNSYRRIGRTYGFFLPFSLKSTDTEHESSVSLRNVS